MLGCARRARRPKLSVSERTNRAKSWAVSSVSSSVMSAPAENALPSPVTTTTRTVGSASMASSASSRRATVSEPMAFEPSGPVERQDGDAVADVATEDRHAIVSPPLTDSVWPVM